MYRGYFDELVHRYGPQCPSFIFAPFCNTPLRVLILSLLFFYACSDPNRSQPPSPQDAWAPDWLELLSSEQDHLTLPFEYGTLDLDLNTLHWSLLLYKNTQDAPHGSLAHLALEWSMVEERSPIIDPSPPLFNPLDRWTLFDFDQHEQSIHLILKPLYDFTHDVSIDVEITSVAQGLRFQFKAQTWSDLYFVRRLAFPWSDGGGPLWHCSTSTPQVDARTQIIPTFSQQPNQTHLPYLFQPRAYIAVLSSSWPAVWDLSQPNTYELRTAGHSLQIDWILSPTPEQRWETLWQNTHPNPLELKSQSLIPMLALNSLDPNTIASLKDTVNSRGWHHSLIWLRSLALNWPPTLPNDPLLLPLLTEVNEEHPIYFIPWNHPYVDEQSPLWATDQTLWVHDQSGEVPIVEWLPQHKGSLIDASHPALSDWIRETQTPLNDFAFAGFYTTYLAGFEWKIHQDLRFANGLDQWEMHQRQIDLWLKAQRQALLPQSWLFASCSGPQGSQWIDGLVFDSPLYAQNTSVEETLKTLLARALSLALATFPSWGTFSPTYDPENAQAFWKSLALQSLMPLFIVQGEFENFQDNDWKHLQRFWDWRNAILPYLKLSMQNHSTPLWRPVAWDLHIHSYGTLYLEWNEVLTELEQCDDEFLWGPSMLVAPVFQKNPLKRKVLLPPDVWFDWYLGTRLDHQIQVELDVTSNQLPIFVRNHSLIPMNLPDPEHRSWDALHTAYLRIYGYPQGTWKLDHDVTVRIQEESRTSTTIEVSIYFHPSDQVNALLVEWFGPIVSIKRSNLSLEEDLTLSIAPLQNLEYPAQRLLGNRRLLAIPAGFQCEVQLLKDEAWNGYSVNGYSYE